MKEIYFVRHGQTLFNLQDKVQGFCDSPLTKTGVEVAKKLGKALKDIPFDAVYASTSERAFDTANYAMQNRDIQVVLDKRIKEFNFGTLEGELHESKVLLEGRSKDPLQLLIDGWVDVGGENLSMVHERIASFFEDIKDVDGKILIVSHGMWIAAALIYLDPSSLEMLASGVENCSVSKVIEKNGKYQVAYVNNTSLLKGE